MLTRRTRRKIKTVLRVVVTALVVLLQGFAAAFLVLFRRSDLMLIRYTRTVQACLVVGLLAFAGVIVYAAMNRWPWYADVFAGWQVIRLIVFTGSVLLTEKEPDYEYVDGKRWR